MRSVLLIGLDPHSVPGIDAAMVDAAIAMGNRRFADAGIEADMCLVTDDDRAPVAIAERLARKPYDCVVIGGGLRKPDTSVALLEQVIALVRRHAPRAAIAFNTNPMTSLDAVDRVT